MDTLYRAGASFFSGPLFTFPRGFFFARHADFHGRACTASVGLGHHPPPELRLAMAERAVHSRPTREVCTYARLARTTCPVPGVLGSIDCRLCPHANTDLMADDNHTLQNLVAVAAATELRHFALGAMFAPKFTTAEGLSDRERGEVAETFVAWKAADKALSDCHARRRYRLG